MAVDTSTEDLASVARDIASRLSEQLPHAVLQLLTGEGGTYNGFLQLECNLLTNGVGGVPRTLKVASLDLGPSNVPTPEPDLPSINGDNVPREDRVRPSPTSRSQTILRPRSTPISPVLSGDDADSRPEKRRKATGGLRVAPVPNLDSHSGAVVRRLESDTRVFPQRKKRLSDNPALQPSTLDKFIGGVWESIYSGVKLDPNEVIEQWQAIEANGQPRLLMEADHDLVVRDETALQPQGVFGRINVLTRKISQTSRTCRSLEVIVQAYWVQCFDDRVADLTVSMAREKAKKAAIAEACVDFNWSEKELRNKMGIWRGYHDIKNAGGWAALVFAGMGLYRFCKYRVSFTEETFQILRSLRHRFEVAADTLHPRWRQLLGIIGGPTERKYTGHPHDWVVGAPTNEAIPLPETYKQWNANFTYHHLDESVVDEDAWGLYDPRVVANAASLQAYKCQTCGEQQSEQLKQNMCCCFPNLYGSPKAGFVPVQVYRTPNGKNNGLLACCAFERGSAVGEFVGEITSGLAGLDVMVGQTERATYQIWQGKQGNHIRFVNHSCQPNSQFERFVWLGTQRIVLVSKGIEAGEEITVDYSDTYWKNLDKVCLCGSQRCRYRNRNLLTPPEST